MTAQHSTPRAKREPHVYIGRPTPRSEDHRLITGTGRFVADIDREGQVWARTVRSPVARGRLHAVRTEAAASHPNVLAVVTARDIPGIDGLRLPIRGHLSGEYNPYAMQPPLAIDAVRYVGEPIAIVVASDPYVAEDAAELVTADIEELTPVLDPVEAAGDGAPELCPGVSRNVASEYRFRSGRPVDEVFANADLVICERFRTNRHSAFPLETRGLVAELDPASKRLTVWGPTKVKQTQLAALAGLLGLPASAIRFLEPDVGGAFGVRGEFYSEDFLIPWLAIELGRPVKWIEDRAEALVETNHSREHVFDVAVAATSDGALLGLRSQSWCSMGGYLRSTGLVLPESSAIHLPGPYRWLALDVTARAVLTNKTPAGTYRGPGEVEATFVRERMLDAVADRVGIDPVELRRRNLVPPESMPYSFGYGPGENGIVYESGDFPAQLEALLDHTSYTRLRGEQAERRRMGELIGIGIGCGLDESGHGPFEDARIVAEQDGTYTCYVGLASGGQGTATTVAQIAAEHLDVPIESVTVNFHDTDAVPVGYGASASRQTVVGGSAVVLAAEDFGRRAKSAGAVALGIGENDVELADGSVTSRIDGSTVSLARLGVEGRGRFEKADIDFSFCAAMAVVVVDAGTGELRIERYVGAYDVGRAINPLTVDGLLEGAAAQGLGGALFEECVYDGSGRPLSTTLMDYLMPTVAQLPEIESLVFEFRSRQNLLGAKGAAQNGIITTHAAVANAVADAIGRPASINHLPLRPSAVFELLHGSDGRGA
jgi:carbon-monoxide dehydrogenase large subunit